MLSLACKSVVSASGGGNLNKNFPNIQMPRGVARGGGGGMLKLRFDWYINTSSAFNKRRPTKSR